MASFALTIIRLLRALRRASRDALFRSSFYLLLLIMFSGTMFYATVEGLRWVDAFYLSVVTLTTLGYGDLHPVTDVGKLFTVIYLFSGMGVVITVVTRLARAMFREPTSKHDDP
ncbi:MAG: two pore domain potassium channel family protein [Rhodobacteraceae bacterium]|nr:two pore domain potassium channel family protein [Paracoccaceae bacterium]